ncbi:MAG: phosphatase PAP2 family protein [Deltaproteobacteria bacterium]|nr:phosphatase PAP2 family protein [Deltaproteobacteria bacterium]
MIRFQKAFAVLISIAVLIIFSIQLDYLFAGRIPQSESLVAVARFFSLVGNGLFLISVCAIIFGIGYRRRNMEIKEAGIRGILSVIVGGVAVHILKAAFERPRIEHGSDAIFHFLQNPSFFDLTGKYNSFPSGHTTVTFAVAYVLSKKFPRLMPLFYLIALLVAASRVYLGSHYPTDTLIGAFLGISVGYLLMTRERIAEKWLIAGLAVLIISVSFFKTGGFLLFDVDEAVFSEASREMVETGDLITPTYNYEPRYDKPILIYWFMSAAFTFFGITEFAARFTSGLFGTLLVLMTFFFIRRNKGNGAALFVSLALLLNLEYFVYTHSAVTDMTLAFFITASVYSFYLAIRENKRLWYMSFWAASALAVLTKGVIGILFPVVIGFLFLFLSKKLSRAKDFLKPSYIAQFLLISVPWFAAEFYVNGWEFFNAFIIKHHFQRYSEVISSHSGPFYYYIIVLLIGFFPWVSMLPTGIYKGYKEKSSKDSDGLYLLTSIWFVFVLIFFSIAKTKLPNYIFPLYPPAAIMAGLVIAEIAGKSPERKKNGIYIMMILAGIIANAIFVLPFIEMKAQIPFNPIFFFELGLIFFIIAVLALVAIFRPMPAMLGIAGMSAVLIIFLRLYALPPVNIFFQKTLYTYSTYARNLGKDGVLATYEINKPSIAFYSQRKVIKIEQRDACNIKEFAKKQKFLLITSPSRYNEVKDYEGLKVIDSTKEYMLLGTEGLPPFQAR